MAGSRRTTTTPMRPGRVGRQSPGRRWLLALALAPLLLAAISCGHSQPKMDLGETHASSLTSPSTGTPAPSLAPLSIVHSGNAVTVEGNLPDNEARTSLTDAIKGAFGSDVQLADNLTIKPDSSTIDFAGLNAVLKAANSMPSFTFKVQGDTVTLTGTAASEDEAAAVEAAAIGAWQDLNIVNGIDVKGPPAGPSS
ncbi:MAG TPA: BON domain-containing protein [Mycobacterium sp.]